MSATRQSVDQSGAEIAPRLWDIKDVSAFGVPVATIYQWQVRSEGPPAMRLGRHLRYDPAAVSAWAHDQEDTRRGRRHR